MSFCTCERTDKKRYLGLPLGIILLVTTQVSGSLDQAQVGEQTCRITGQGGEVCFGAAG